MPVVYSRKRLRALDPTRVPFPSSPTQSSPKPSPSPQTVPAKRPQKRRRLVQLHLDAGQKHISHITCPECGMTYTPGLEADERLHRTHHRKRRAPDGLAWRSMRKLRCVDGVRDGEKCVVVRAEDTAVRRRVARVCGVVDEMLNVAAEIRGVSGGNGGWVCVLYVCNARVSGFLLCECVGAAGIGMVRKDGSVRMTGKRLRKMLCGIQKMWVDETKRRSGIATRMVDVARTYLKYAHEYKRDEVAFTPVTSTGAHLASGYCGNEKVLIYGTRRDERKNGVGACDGKEKPENVSVSENV